MSDPSRCALQSPVTPEPRMPTTRRQFLTSAALTTTSLAFLNRLTPVSAPVSWALDRFKAAEMETQKPSGWRMSPISEENPPSASKARRAFIEAMDPWDEPAADLAAASLARHASRNECFELFARYGAR